MLPQAVTRKGLSTRLIAREIYRKSCYSTSCGSTSISGLALLAGKLRVNAATFRNNTFHRSRRAARFVMVNSFTAAV